MEIALNGNETLNSLDNEANLIQCKDVERYDNVDALLGKHNETILSCHASENFGHWVCMYRVGKTVHFFDSYGVMIDDQLKFSLTIGAGALIGAVGAGWQAFSFSLL